MESSYHGEKHSFSYGRLGLNFLARMCLSFRKIHTFLSTQIAQIQFLAKYITVQKPMNLNFPPLLAIWLRIRIRWSSFFFSDKHGFTHFLCFQASNYPRIVQCSVNRNRQSRVEQGALDIDDFSVFTIQSTVEICINLYMGRIFLPSYCWVCSIFSFIPSKVISALSQLPFRRPFILIPNGSGISAINLFEILICFS